MGLDMFAARICDGSKLPDLFDKMTTDDPLAVDIASRTLVICRWRKHSRLHGWMDKLYRARGGSGDFNTGEMVRLRADDLDELMRDMARGLPRAHGFFWGESTRSDHLQTLAFVAKAREHIASGSAIYYESDW